MRSDIKRAAIIGAVGVFGLLSAAGCRAGTVTDGGPRVGGPSPSPLAVTPQPPRVGGGTVEVVQELIAATPTPIEEPTAIAATPIANVAPVARLPPTEGARSASTPPAVIPPPAGGDLEAQVRAAVERYFPPAEWATAMRIAKCESGYQPWAVEPGGAHFGVWQVDPQIWGTVPSDIEEQTRQAAGIVAKNGWSPWQCR